MSHLSLLSLLIIVLIIYTLIKLMNLEQKMSSINELESNSNATAANYFTVFLQIIDLGNSY